MNLRIVPTTCCAFILLLGLWGCQDNTNQANSAEEPLAENQPVTEISSCYAYLEGGDTIKVRITQLTDGSIKGFMLFQLKEKDKNVGTFTGEKEGDLILAEYSFQSEGKTSIRQVAFQQSGNTLKEGYGEIIETGGQLAFKNPDQLDYDHSMVLKKVDCAVLDLPVAN